jgi:hypothetical protein
LAQNTIFGTPVERSTDTDTDTGTETVAEVEAEAVGSKDCPHMMQEDLRTSSTATQEMQTEGDVPQ